MAVAFRALRARGAPRLTQARVRPSRPHFIGYRFSSSYSDPGPPNPPFLFRALVLSALGLGYFMLGSSIPLYSAREVLKELMEPPTDEETLALFEPQTDEQRKIDEHILNHPLAIELNAKEGIKRSRPHMKVPQAYKRHNFAGGTLAGPGRIETPPWVWETPGENLVSILYLGKDLCGHPGIIHGGLLATMLDEGLARCCFQALPAKMGMTANIKVDYRAPAMADRYYVLRAETTKVDGRKAWVTGRIETLPEPGEKPVVVTEGTALFVSPKQANFLQTIFPSAK
ncbi:Thioesterase/thiol ester dehydrase-isomerase [Xylariaceae sp. FL0255]|nr:Thioesterase/thiol ester dehydrase-isomerase [Xylariaceae sp. FL0255]